MPFPIAKIWPKQARVVSGEQGLVGLTQTSHNAPINQGQIEKVSCKETKALV